MYKTHVYSIQLQSKSWHVSATWFLPNFLGFRLSASEPTVTCGVSHTHKQPPVMDYKVTQHSVHREYAERLEFLVSFTWPSSTATRGFWVLFRPLVFLVTTSIKEWNPVYNSQMNSSLEIWRGGRGREREREKERARFVTERAKTENSRLYCQSHFGYFVLSKQKTWA